MGACEHPCDASFRLGGARRRENQSVRTRTQELRKRRFHRQALGCEHEADAGNPESSSEAIATGDEVYRESCKPQAEFGDIRVRCGGSDSLRRQRRRTKPKHFPRDRFERIDGRRENRTGEGGGTWPPQAAPSDRPDL